MLEVGANICFGNVVWGPIGRFVDWAFKWDKCWCDSGATLCKNGCSCFTFWISKEICLGCYGLVEIVWKTAVVDTGG